MESWNYRKILKICTAANVQIPNSNALPMANVQIPMSLELPRGSNAVVVAAADVVAADKEAGRGEAPNNDL
jgi:hypothetical protein